MAKNQVFADIESTREVWLLDAPTDGGVAVMNGKRAGVTLSGTPGRAQSVSFGPYTISGIPLPDNGQLPLHSTVHTTGTFEFPVVGADGTQKTGTDAYFVVATKSLTFTKVDDATTPFFGVVNLPEGYVHRGTLTPVKIGVVA